MILGLASLRPQVGKSTIADYLIKKYGFISVEMSTPVIYLSSKYFGYNGNKSDPEQRAILQAIGYAGKQIDPTIWIYYSIMTAVCSLDSDNFNYANLVDFKSKIKNGGFFDGSNIIVSGIRSPFEANEIKSFGGQVWLIERNVGEVNEGFKHKVENQLDGYDGFSHKIQNDSTFESLYEKIENLLPPSFCSQVK